MFTLNSIKALYTEQGITTELISGFFITFYLGIKEIQIDRNSEYIHNILANEKVFNKIYEIKKELFKNLDITTRESQI